MEAGKAPLVRRKPHSRRDRSHIGRGVRGQKPLAMPRAFGQGEFNLPRREIHDREDSFDRSVGRVSKTFVEQAFG